MDINAPSTNMADEDCPPLEEMSEVINRISAMKAQAEAPKVAETRTIVQSDTNNGTKPKQPQKMSSSQSLSHTSSSASTHNTACGFGGMKKGFLSGSNESKKAKQIPASLLVDDIPHIKPQSQSSRLVIGDVQRAMREQLQKTDAWLTEDLLSKLGNNEKLMTMMADPRCEVALHEFQENPDNALVKYQNDKYIQDFFREFCDVLGNHYENLHDASLDVAQKFNSSDSAAKSEAAPTTERREELIKEVKTRKTTKHNPHPKESEEDLRVKQVLSDPKLIEILQSPNIIELIKSLKEDPEKAQRLLQKGGKEFQQKVKTLVDAGLLAFQR